MSPQFHKCNFSFILYSLSCLLRSLIIHFAMHIASIRTDSPDVRAKLIMVKVSDATYRNILIEPSYDFWHASELIFLTLFLDERLLIIINY